MNSEKLRLKHSIIFPALFVLIMWVVKLVEHFLNAKFYVYGIFPLKINSLPGIIFSPFIHSDFSHLISNTLPLFVLFTALIYFYKKNALIIFIIVYLIPGTAVWLIGRQAYHIGASGVVYGLAFFLIFAGMLAKNKALTAVSFAVIFLYGSIVWGILPTDNEISWESHLFGAIAGILSALAFAKYQSLNSKNKSEIFSNDYSQPDISNNSINEIMYFFKDDDES